MTPAARPPRLWTGLALLLALAGAVIGGVLTRIKLRQLALPCVEPSSGCPLSEPGGCGDVLASPWATWFDQPLSLWATAFYTLVAVLLLVLLRRPRALAGSAPHLLLALTLVAVAMSAVMGAYSYLVLGTYCRFCLALYAISLLFLACGDGIYRHMRHHGLPPWRDAWRQPGARLDAWFLGSLVFLAAAGAQAIAGQLWRAAQDPGEQCPILTGIPRTDLVFGAADPDVLLVAYLDPTCRHCRRKYTDLVELTRDGTLGAAQVRVLLFPRQACDRAAFTSFDASAADAQANDACRGALAVECVERLHPGHGAAMLGHLYARHDELAAAPLFDAASVAAAARAAGLDDPAGLTACIDGADALARITDHQRALLDLWKDTDAKKQQLPVLMAIPVQAGFPEFQHTQFIPAGASKTALRRLIDNLREQRPL